MKGKPVTLVDGTVVDSWSEEWRAETAARHAEALWLLKAADLETAIVGAVARLGGGEEQERRLRAVLRDMLLRGLDAEAERVLGLAYLEDRRAAVDEYEARWGRELAEALRERVRAIWEARRAAAA